MTECSAKERKKLSKSILIIIASLICKELLKRIKVNAIIVYNIIKGRYYNQI